MTFANSHSQSGETIGGSLLLVGQVAEMLNVHPTTVKKWANKGLLPCYRLGPRGDRRFKLDDVMDFIGRGSVVEGPHSSPLGEAPRARDDSLGR